MFQNLTCSWFKDSKKNDLGFRGFDTNLYNREEYFLFINNYVFLHVHIYRDSRDLTIKLFL